MLHSPFATVAVPVFPPPPGPEVVNCVSQLGLVSVQVLPPSVENWVVHGAGLLVK